MVASTAQPPRDQTSSTPVIGMHDTARELVRSQTSGLLVSLECLSELPAAIRQAVQLDPRTVRDRAARSDLPADQCATALDGCGA
jgi:hypothetical protein